MAIKLLAHILRGTTSDAARATSADEAADGRRWAFRDLVVRRVDLAAWGLAYPLPGMGKKAVRREGSAEPMWAETQPWCHD